MRRGRVLRLRVSRSRLSAEVVEGGAIVWAGEASYASNIDVTEAIARLAAEAQRPCRRLTVILEQPPVQLRTLAELPPVKRRHLTALVAQQAGRFFRQNGHSLVTDVDWLGKNAPDTARAAAVDETLVEAIAAGARAAGLSLETVAPACVDKPLSLLPRSERESRERRARRRVRRLTVATCGIWLCAGAAFLGRLTWERRAVERELKTLEGPLAAVLDARRELRDAEATLDAVTLAERERGRGLVMLGAITSALPDSSVLTSLAWSADGSGVLIGAARHATAVVARLDRLSTLAGVRLGGPVVHDQIGGRDWERFSILFGDAEGRKRGGS